MGIIRIYMIFFIGKKKYLISICFGHYSEYFHCSNQINCVYCMVKYKSVVDFTAHCQTASHNNKKQIFKEQRLEAALLMAKAKAEKKAVENETVAATTTSASEAGNENSSKDVSDLPDITTAPVEVAGVTERGRSVCSKQDNHDGSTTGGGSGSSGGDSGAGSSPVRSSVCSSARSSPISELAGGNSSEGTVSTADSCITAYWEEFAAAQTSGTETDEESPSGSEMVIVYSCQHILISSIQTVIILSNRLV